MTKKTKHLRKLGNALRALYGGRYVQPQKKAVDRVVRWTERCEKQHYI